MRLSVSAVCVLLATSLALPAVAKTPTAESLDRKIRAELKSCAKRAASSDVQGGGLVVHGLKVCFQHSNTQWEEATAKLIESRPQLPDSDCGRALQTIRDDWRAYSEKLLAAETLQYLPINSDDGIRLVLAKHLYELVYDFNQIYGC